MSRKEIGVDNSDLVLELGTDLVNKVKLKDDAQVSLTNKTAAKTADPDSNFSGEAQTRGNSSFVQDGVQSAISNEIKEQEQVGSYTDDQLFYLPPENLISAQKVLGNDLTLRKILSHVDFRDLYKLRLVNKLWEAEATSILMNQEFRSLYLTFEPKEKSFYHNSCFYSTERNKKRPLAHLNNSISSSRRFPCGSVEILGAGTLETPDMLEFLRLHGKEMKCLEVSDYCEDYTNKPISLMRICSLQKLLTDRAPNLKTLIISQSSESSELERGVLLFPGPKKVILPNLRCLSFGDYTSQICEIILAAPNLQEIRGSAFKAVDALALMNKIHLVQYMNFMLETMDPTSRSRFLELVEKWAEAKPKFTILGLYSVPGNMGKSLSKILEASRESLGKTDDPVFHLVGTVALGLKKEFFHGVIWPPLENVKSLSMSEGLRDVQILPPNFLFDVFPNLVKLDVRGTWGTTLSNTFFDTTDCEGAQFPCLKHVKISGGNPRVLKLLVKAAPNVEDLELRDMHQFSPSVRCVWGFSKVRKVFLGSSFHRLIFENGFPGLDMAITGLSEQVVRRLHADPAFFQQMDGTSIPRDSPSILDCQALETVTLSFMDSSNYGMLWKPNFTAVSGKYGFKMMSGVNVILRCTPCCASAFKPLAPYVKMNVGEMKI